MKRIVLSQVRQGGHVFYSGVADPRVLAHMAVSPNSRGQEQYQRALSPRRVESISLYAADDQGETGMLPGTLILGTRETGRLTVKSGRATVVDESGTSFSTDTYYIDFPETEEELAQYEDSIDVLDGQHRLFAFLRENLKLADDVPYLISFNLYENPTLYERRKIFKVANEEQKPVAANLLYYFREKLGLLKEQEQPYQPVVDALAGRLDSPLYGRVIRGDETITRGVKAIQLVKIFDKGGLNKLRIQQEPVNQEQLYQMICTYLHGWEDACGFYFADPQKGETATKISGLRYILLMLPAFWEEAKSAGRKFDRAFVAEMLGQLGQALGMEQVIQVFSDPIWAYAFRGEGATVKLAEDHVQMLKQHLQDKNARDFNPLE